MKLDFNHQSTDGLLAFRDLPPDMEDNFIDRFCDLLSGERTRNREYQLIPIDKISCIIEYKAWWLWPNSRPIDIILKAKGADRDTFSAGHRIKIENANIDALSKRLDPDKFIPILIKDENGDGLRALVSKSAIIECGKCIHTGDIILTISDNGYMVAGRKTLFTIHPNSPNIDTILGIENPIMRKRPPGKMLRF